MEQRARINGTEIAFEIGGQGPPLVWAHGLASCREGDRDVIDAFAEHFTVLSYDARGHGRSEPVRDPAAMKYEVLGADLIALLDQVGFDVAVLAGASMGAATCGRVACIAPGRARALVAARPAAAGDDGAAPVWLQLLFAGGAHAIRTGGIDGAIEYLLTIPAAREELERDPDRLATLRKDWERHDPLSIAAALEGVPRSYVLEGGYDVSMITCPVLIVPGNDLIHPTSAGVEIARSLPNATLAAPFDSLPRHEETRAFVDLVRGFLGALR